MRLKSYVCGIFLLTCVASNALTAQIQSDTRELESKLALSGPTEVPSGTLPNGDYSIHVIGHLSDRLILEVSSAGGTAYPAFIGLLHTNLNAPSKPGPIPFDAGPAEGTSALRGFAFAHGPTVEFVYPKAAAVSLAKVNPEGIVAIDPASEGITASPNLSKKDMEVVTLWTLSSTRVGGDNDAPAIKAERYRQVASASAPQLAIKQLPHTASDRPLLILLATLFLLGAAAIRFTRFFRRGAIGA